MRIAVPAGRHGSSCPDIYSCPKAEESLDGKTVTEEIAEQAGELAVRNLYSDHRYPGYRRLPPAIGQGVDQTDMLE